MKPILFNTEMVRAILEDQKTATRRIIKFKYNNTHHEMFTNKYGTRLIEIQNEVEGETFGKNADGSTWHKLRGYIEPKAPYKKRDILYVMETWQVFNTYPSIFGFDVTYKADKFIQSCVFNNMERYFKFQ